jgi:hypothetical protein
MVKWFVRVREVATDRIVEDFSLSFPVEIEPLESLYGPKFEVSITAVSVN